MRRSKKLIIAAVLAGVLLFGSLGGIALAQDNEDTSQPAAQIEALWDRVSEIYEQKTGVALDQEALKEALAEAQGEMRTQALQNRLQSLVDQDIITQGEADAYLDWWAARPDILVGSGFQGHGGFRGMGGMRGFGGPCLE